MCNKGLKFVRRKILFLQCIRKMDVVECICCKCTLNVNYEVKQIITLDDTGIMAWCLVHWTPSHWAHIQCFR